MPELTDDIDMILFTNTTDADTGVVTQQPVERWEEVRMIQIQLQNFNNWCFAFWQTAILYQLKKQSIKVIPNHYQKSFTLLLSHILFDPK